MFNRKWITNTIFAIFIGLLLIAALPAGVTHMTDLWIGDRTASPDVTPGDNDLYVNGTMEVDGAARLDGTLTAAAINASGTVATAGLLDLNGGYALPILAKTANYTIAATDAGTIFTNQGAGDEITFVMPEASTILGRPFHFMTVDNNTVNIDVVDGTDKLIRLTDSAGDKIQYIGTTSGCTISLVAIADNTIGALIPEVCNWTDAN